MTQANTPFLDSLFATYPHTQILCYGEAVGLPEGQMGNSEVGHLNLGAGRVVYQDITRINKAIKEGRLKQNPAMGRALARVKEKGSTLHLLGLVSDGGVHSSLDHLHALIQLAADEKVPEVAIHAFLDGRDTPPDSSAGYLQDLRDFLKPYPQAKIASVGGRYWGMDRDNRWDRVETAYAAMVRGQCPTAQDPVAYVKACYAKGGIRRIHKARRDA